MRATYDKHVNNEGGDVTLGIQLNNTSEVALVGSTFNRLNDETRDYYNGTIFMDELIPCLILILDGKGRKGQ